MILTVAADSSALLRDVERVHDLKVASLKSARKIKLLRPRFSKLTLMPKLLRQIQPVLAYAAAHLDGDVSLAALARQAGKSPFHLHRVLAAFIGETPKQLTLRLRLG